ncbi:Ldh family oxidoreductase [Streptomyces sp. HB132]|uniref:Ldh family oxidoreductase n=1 Tax=Streptomyces sp. HB132 TaxID=767388 RepID=UPI001961857A|nr:Ldh family oxidoreductase [Streptomyces sp. HB132]MBM7440691.1 LDH2 family malate/lactate/ureidoglycolate dehydrogenase [Streptomyces sp. HB132]
MRTSHESLHDFVREAMCRAGARPEDADQVARVLVAADLNGVDSHGVARLRRYVEGIRKGTIAADATPTVVSDFPAGAVVDAGNGLGQPAMLHALDLAVRKAQDTAIAMVTVRRSNHFGIAGHYAAQGARQGMLTIVTTNASPQVAPTHGAEPMFGTNPLAFALPTHPTRPYLYDAATSAVPRGKLERLEREERPMLPGWAVDPQGRTETDIPSLVKGLKAREGYALLPLGGAGEDHGGHKGYGLGLLADLLCGPLAGASWGRHVYGPDGAGLGHMVICARAAAFIDLDSFRAETAAMFDELRDAKKAEGQDRIFIPGEKEYERADERRAHGIPLRPAVVADLGDIAASLDMPPLESIGGLE